MSATDNPKLAVLIDADNASASLVKELLEEVAKFGTATIRRAYGDWTGQQLAGWKDQLNRYAIQPIQQFAYTRGKNSTDASLIIDAMDLLYADHVDGFCLVSSDSDFTRLATRLRESRKVVYGLGERKTPEAFRAACDRFVFFEVLKRGTSAPDANRTDAPDVKPIDDVPDLEHALRQAFDAVSRDNGWATLSSVGSYMAKNNPSFDTRLYGYRKLSDMVRKQPFIEAESAQGANGPLLMVRIKPRVAQAPVSTSAPSSSKTRAPRGRGRPRGVAAEASDDDEPPSAASSAASEASSGASSPAAEATSIIGSPVTTLADESDTVPSEPPPASKRSRRKRN